MAWAERGDFRQIIFDFAARNGAISLNLRQQPFILRLLVFASTGI
jgi:hypothetical protein